MKKLLIVLTGLSLATALPAAAQQNSDGCYNNTVRNSSGATISLSNGFGYMVTPGRDRSTVTMWMPMDKVTVCRGKGSTSIITNISKNPPTSIQALKQ